MMSHLDAPFNGHNIMVEQGRPTSRFCSVSGWHREYGRSGENSREGNGGYWKLPTIDRGTEDKNEDRFSGEGNWKEWIGDSEIGNGDHSPIGKERISL